MNKYDLIDCKDKDVLDVGCSVGKGSTFLRGFKSYTGIDIDKRAIRYAKRFEREGVSFFNKSATDIFGSYDVIILYDVIEHIKNQKEIIDNIKRILRPNGRFYLVTPDRDNIIKKFGRIERYHPYELNMKELKELVKDFKIVNIKSYETMLTLNGIKKIEILSFFRKVVPFRLFQFIINDVAEPSLEIEEYNPKLVGIFMELTK
ncbi:MAG: class I SAM-dependent methyltransferase [Candidatus Aenigmatarchaeota archaeon]